MMKVISKSLRVLVYLALTLVTCKILADGPMYKVVKDKFSMIDTFVDLEDLAAPFEWPYLAICRTPIDKSPLKYQEFMTKGKEKSFKDEKEFYGLLNETFYTRPDEFIHAITISNEYFSALGANKSDIPIEPPYVHSVFVDVAYNGMCAAVSFKSLRKYLVSKGKAKEGDKDATFSAIIWLKGTNHQSASFFTKLSQEEEFMLVGVNNLINSEPQIIPYSSMKIAMLEFGIFTRINSCDEENYISGCLQKYFDDKYGHDLNNLTEKKMKLVEAKFSGPDNVKALTGCQIKCENKEYFVSSFADIPREHARDQAYAYLNEKNYTTSSIYVLNHMKATKIRKREEIPAYTPLTFISEVGGIVGIFLGLSFWSLYEILIGPGLDR